MFVYTWCIPANFSLILGRSDSAMQDSILTVASDTATVSAPFSHVWPHCRQEKENLRTLVSPSSAVLCNLLMQHLSISYTLNEEMRGKVPTFEITVDKTS